jgi:hypothetical protein
MSLRPGQAGNTEYSVTNASGGFISCQFPEWTSADSTIARVSSGWINGVREGTTVVRARVKDKIDSVIVTVASPRVTAVWIRYPLQLLAGQTAQGILTVEDSNHANLIGLTTAYSSSDTAIAAVSENGMVRARKDGIVDIRATFLGISGSWRIRITRDAPAIRFSAIDAGGQYTCGLVGGGGVRDGTAMCWGDNTWGQLGNATAGLNTGLSSGEKSPVFVTDIGVSYASISAGVGHTCALSAAGDAYCWGSNFTGEVGDGGTVMKTVPTKVSSSVKFSSIVAGTAHTCALTSDGSVYCWGKIANVSSVTPLKVGGFPKIVQLVTQDLMICGLSESGEVLCLGKGDGVIVTKEYGQPTRVAGGMKFKAIAAGSYHTCGLREDGAAFCWGMNAVGQIDPSSPKLVEQPQQLHGSFTFSSIAAGGHMTCGIMTAGGSRCIGMTQLSNSSNGRAQSLLEIPGEGDHPFVAISGGAFHTCAIDRQGGAWCWGEQRFGAVGAGDSATESEPLQIRVER